MQRVKQHRQSIDGFRQGRRDDLVQVEEAQLAIDETYLPEQVDASAVDEAIATAIRDSGAQKCDRDPASENASVASDSPLARRLSRPGGGAVATAMAAATCIR